MNRFQTFQEFLMTQTEQLGILGFVIGIILTFCLSYILRSFYIKYGKSLSNRRIFAENLIMIAMTTMVIITIVKSSLALSLGLVVALSIVRFRTAIKDPEELSDLVLAIAIGLGFGAGQIGITIIGFLVIIAAIRVRHRSFKSNTGNNLYLTISGTEPGETLIEQIVELIKNNTVGVSLRRLDETKESFEAIFLVEFSGFEQLQTVKKELKKLNDSIRITFLENKGEL